MATFYWVGGAGDWDNTNSANWSDSSGGSGGFGVPTASDEVRITSDSGTGSFIITLRNTARGNQVVLDNEDAIIRLSANVDLQDGISVSDYDYDGSVWTGFNLWAGTLSLNNYVLTVKNFFGSFATNIFGYSQLVNFGSSGSVVIESNQYNGGTFNFVDARYLDSSGVPKIVSHVGSLVIGFSQNFDPGWLDNEYLEILESNNTSNGTAKFVLYINDTYTGTVTVNGGKYSRVNFYGYSGNIDRYTSADATVYEELALYANNQLRRDTDGFWAIDGAEVIISSPTVTTGSGGLALLVASGGMTLGSTLLPSTVDSNKPGCSIYLQDGTLDLNGYDCFSNIYRRKDPGSVLNIPDSGTATLDFGGATIYSRIFQLEDVGDLTVTGEPVGTPAVSMHYLEYGTSYLEVGADIPFGAAAPSGSIADETNAWSVGSGGQVSISNQIIEDDVNVIFVSGFFNNIDFDSVKHEIRINITDQLRLYGDLTFDSVGRNVSPSIIYTQMPEIVFEGTLGSQTLTTYGHDFKLAVESANNNGGLILADSFSLAGTASNGTGIPLTLNNGDVIITAGETVQISGSLVSTTGGSIQSDTTDTQAYLITGQNSQTEGVTYQDINHTGPALIALTPSNTDNGNNSGIIFALATGLLAFFL